MTENKIAFQDIDADHSGTITCEECIVKIRQINASSVDQINEEDVQHFVEKVDVNKTGEINYSQFLCATLSPTHFSEENVKSLFHFLDNHEQGYLTKESLLLTFKRNARDIDMDKVESMMEELGINAASSIDFEQFRSLIDPNYQQ